MDAEIIAQKLLPVLHSKPASMIVCSLRLQIFQDSNEKGGNMMFLLFLFKIITNGLSSSTLPFSSCIFSFCLRHKTYLVLTNNW